MCRVGLECCRGAGSLVLPCRMLGCTGNSHWKMPCINLHGMSLVVVVFLVVELILYVELTVETWSCWIACGNTVVLVEWMDCVWKHCTQRRLKYLSLDIFSLLFFGNNSVHRIIVLVWMYAGCMWIRPYVLLVEEMQIQPLF